MGLSALRTLGEQCTVHCQADTIIPSRMENYLGTLSNEIYDHGLPAKESGLPCPSSLMLGVFVTMLPKMVPRILPFFMNSDSPGLKAKFDDPNYLKEGEQMFKDKFTENLQMVEDIIASVGNDNQLEKKSSEYTGFKKFLFGSLEALDINVSDYLGGLEVDSIRKLARIARGEDVYSPYYIMAADALLAVGSYLYQTIFL